LQRLRFGHLLQT